MNEGEHIKSHLDELNSIIIDMQDMDIEIESEDHALIVLYSLPSSYDIFVER